MDDLLIEETVQRVIASSQIRQAPAKIQVNYYYYFNIIGNYLKPLCNAL